MPAAVSAALFAWLVAVTSGGQRPDPFGHPLGTDFVSFWTAARLALAGQPQAAWDPVLHRAAEQAAFAIQAGFAPLDYAFFYPPPFLLLCWPFGLLPYPAALALWLALTTGAALTALLALTPRDWRATMAAIATPALLLNAEHGQNAALWASLFGFAALLLDRRPALAGLCLGALCCKPQLALLIAPGLIAAGRWRALIAAALGGTFLCAASLVLLGAGSWRAFWSSTGLARQTLEDGLVGFEKMASSFAAARLVGASSPAAWLAQSVMTACALLALVVVVRRRNGARTEIAAMAAASCLATPFLLDYDLALLLVPPTVLFARLAGRAPSTADQITLLGLALLPIVLRPLALHAGLPAAPLAAGVLLARMAWQAYPASDLTAATTAGSVQSAAPS